MSTSGRREHVNTVVAMFLVHDPITTHRDDANHEICEKRRDDTRETKGIGTNKSKLEDNIITIWSISMYAC